VLEHRRDVSRLLVRERREDVGPRRLIHEFARAAPAAALPEGFDDLTARELEVFKLVAYESGIAVPGGAE
jgi:hypothetical protein